MVKPRRIVRTLAALAVAGALAAPVSAQQVTFMTGPQGGSWIPLGGALKGMWEKAIKGLSIQQTPGAGITKVDRKSTRLNSSHMSESRMPSSA